MRLRITVWLGVLPALVTATLVTSIFAAPLASPVFVKTRNSDEWVTKTFHIQKRYQRVLLVQAGGQIPHTVRVPDLDLNAADTLKQTKHSYSGTKISSSLQEAADAASGGDLVAVMPGTYAGFVLGDKPDASDNHFIHFKAMGQPGEVTINRPSERDPDWM